MIPATRSLEPLDIADRLLKNPDLDGTDLDALRLIIARAVRIGRGEQPDPCEVCNGSGEVTREADPERDRFTGSIDFECPQCGGSGWTFD